MGLAEKAPAGHWEEHWRGARAPRPILPRGRGVAHFVDRAFHRLFAREFSARAGAGARLLEVGCAQSVWLPYFARAGGFVSEVGGWLSHPAILAREYDVAMIVGTEGIGRIAEGNRLRLYSDGRIELVEAISHVAAA